MKLQKSLMTRKMAVRCFSLFLLGGACLMPAVAAPDKVDAKPAAAEPAKPVAKPAEAAPAKPAGITSIQGTCTFNGKKSNWSAKLTPKGDGTYDAAYISSWSGKPLEYTGTLKTDLKTEISGTGKAINGKGNGNFEFSGKYGADGIAQCSYKEIGGRRSGTMTAEMAK
jgi:hypothetical protein